MERVPSRSADLAGEGAEPKWLCSRSADLAGVGT